MELSHRFTVPIGVEETWAHFNDIASVAECFPGAVVTEADESSFAGSVKVKLGPIALLYTGSGTFVEKDPDAHRFVVDAKGKDKRGNGTAGAKVTVSMTDAAGATDVSVETDLAVTGKPAQFGRGVMQDVSDKLLGQFVACLEQRLAAPEPASAPAPAAPADATTAEPPPEPDATTVALATGPAVAAPPVAPPAPPPPAAVRSQPEALDLGSAVVPVLAKSYWRQAFAVVVGVALMRRWRRRRRR
ncbi:SRPBCC family protein [Nocardioides sp. zg-1308]|uniref:SRPBCC domain-containing protein n=1 Tax=Nocardioides TaxID=1839 RepID=UPI0015534E25|nr:SRPBCC domain-containing protein [Nocardioides sp. S-34]NPD05194.1 SRPBCC family protein [Nocardioides sp. zg-1308]WQQ23083.1 SRPBCC family protein [Nocardioides sp. S-34]